MTAKTKSKTASWPAMSEDFDAARERGHVLAKLRARGFYHVVTWDAKLGDAGAWRGPLLTYADKDLAGWWPLPDA